MMIQKFRHTLLIGLALPLLGCTEKKLEFHGLTNPSLEKVNGYKNDGDRVDFETGDESYSITALGRAPMLVTKKLNFLRLTIEGAQHDQRAPYPGSVSRVVKCDPAFAATEKTFVSPKTKLTGFYHFLTARRAIEDCSGSEVRWRGFWGYLQCGEDGEVFEIKVAFPLTAPLIDQRLQSFRCN